MNLPCHRLNHLMTMSAWIRTTVALPMITASLYLALLILGLLFKGCIVHSRFFWSICSYFHPGTHITIVCEASFLQEWHTTNCWKFCGHGASHRLTFSCKSWTQKMLETNITTRSYLKWMANLHLFLTTFGTILFSDDNLMTGTSHTL